MPIREKELCPVWKSITSPIQFVDLVRSYLLVLVVAPFVSIKEMFEKNVHITDLYPCIMQMATIIATVRFSRMVASNIPASQWITKKVKLVWDK